MTKSMIAAMLLMSSAFAGAAEVGRVSGQDAKDTFIALSDACGGDCGASGSGWQRARSAGPVYVECTIQTSDVSGTIQKSEPSKFSCSLNTP